MNKARKLHLNCLKKRFLYSSATHGYPASVPRHLYVNVALEMLSPLLLKHFVV